MPDAFIEEVEIIAVPGAEGDIIPLTAGASAVVGADAHGVDEAEGRAHGEHVLGDVTAEDESIGGGLAEELEAFAVGLDVGHPGVMEFGVAEGLVLVVGIDVDVFGG